MTHNTRAVKTTELNKKICQFLQNCMFVFFLFDKYSEGSSVKSYVRPVKVLDSIVALTFLAILIPCWMHLYAYSILCVKESDLFFLRK